MVNDFNPLFDTSPLNEYQLGIETLPSLTPGSKHSELLESHFGKFADGKCLSVLSERACDSPEIWAACVAN